MSIFLNSKFISEHLKIFKGGYHFEPSLESNQILYFWVLSPDKKKSLSHLSLIIYVFRSRYARNYVSKWMPLCSLFLRFIDKGMNLNFPPKTIFIIFSIATNFTSLRRFGNALHYSIIRIWIGHRFVNWTIQYLIAFHFWATTH